MAEKKLSGFRFRLPWLQQPDVATEPPTQPPRTTTATQTSVQKPPFRPPGKAPASPRSPPQSVATPPPSLPKSPIAKTTQTTIGTLDPATPPQSPPFRPPSPPQSPPPSLPKSPIAKTIKTTQTTIETLDPATPPQSPPFRPPSPPQSPPRDTVQPLSPVQAQQSPTDTPPISPSRLASHSIPEIKRSSEIIQGKGEQTKSINPQSIETKSQKPKQSTTARVPLHREIKGDISKFIHKLKQSMNEKPGSVITIAGDNLGASMNLGSGEIKRGYNLTHGNTAHDAAINGEQSSQPDSKVGENQETKAIVNSNVQGINNSLMFNSSVTERNPGVHLGFSRNLTNINDLKMENAESMEMQRDEVNISPPQKLIYDPTMERSIEGIFMESLSEDEPDDPEMSAKSNEIEVL